MYLKRALHQETSQRGPSSPVRAQARARASPMQIGRFQDPGCAQGVQSRISPAADIVSTHFIVLAIIEGSHASPAAPIPIAFGSATAEPDHHCISLQLTSDNDGFEPNWMHTSFMPIIIMLMNFNGLPTNPSSCLPLQLVGCNSEARIMVHLFGSFSRR